MRRRRPPTCSWASVRARVRRATPAPWRAWVLWTDLDTERSLERLAAFRPLPSIVVRSGSGGAHAYWPLAVPLHAQRANRRLALALGGDMHATDGARIMRPPGTLNHKHTPPREVVCTRLNAAAFSAAEVVARLPDSAHYRRPAPRARQRARADVPRPDRVLDGLARVVAQARVGTRNAALFWAACRALEHAAAGEADERAALDVLSTAALEVGLAGVEIRATIGSAQRTAMRAAA